MVVAADAIEAPTDDDCDDSHERVLASIRRTKRRKKQHHDLSGISSIGVSAHGPLDEYRFNMYMRDLLSEKAKDIFRCKVRPAFKYKPNQELETKGQSHSYARPAAAQLCPPSSACLSTPANVPIS